MRKSKEVSKYNITWQIIRVKLKKIKNVEKKLNMASSFFYANKTLDNQERVMNWLEGLAMGYKASKNQEAIVKIQDLLVLIDEEKDLVKETNQVSITKDMISYSIEDRKQLWTDLYLRNKKWLEKGYTQKEINTFMDNLYSSFTNSEHSFEKIKNQYKELRELRENAKKIVNTHNFFF